MTAKGYGLHTELLGGASMETQEKSGARLSKSSREKLEGMYNKHKTLAEDMRAFLDEDEKGSGIEEGGESGGIEKPKSAPVATEKVLILSGSPDSK
jgi:hypothetical protein